MPFVTVTYPPKYPLTDSEKKWLRERDEMLEEFEDLYAYRFCEHCEYMSPADDFVGCRCAYFNGYGEVVLGDCPIEPRKYYFADAARFEALVARSLACFRNTNQTDFYNLKRARLHVEAVLAGEEDEYPSERISNTL